MGLTMRERQAIGRELSERFRKADKLERGRILDEVVQLTNYSRCYAAYLLRNCGTPVVRMVGGRRVRFIPGHARPVGSKRKRKGHYDGEAFLDPLKRFWALSDGLCGKRLVAFIREVLPHMERQGILQVADVEVRTQLLTISPATADRLLAKTKRLTAFKPRSLTRPGTLLKHHIPIRTFADWNDAQPGFVEADLVGHDGGSPAGDFCQTLNMTDVATAWTEMDAVQNKAQIHVFAALQELRARLPFPLLGLDSDNGSEFINDQLLRYCEQHQVTFTRSRRGKKNDNCFVEQKNYTVVRRTAGYYRYSTPEQLALLQRLYKNLRLYVNFFLPVMKLIGKTRIGSRLTRRYDKPQTPYRRVLAHPNVSQEVKDRLTSQYEALNPLLLKRDLNRLQTALFRSAIARGHPPQPPIPGYPSQQHPWRTAVLGTKGLSPVALDAAYHIKRHQSPVDSKSNNPHTPDCQTSQGASHS